MGLIMDPENEAIANRKLQHIEICTRNDVVFPGNCEDVFKEIILVHQAFPGINLNDVLLSTKFLGYELNAPIIIEAMTGGHESLRTINEQLAKIAKEFKIAIGLGSQLLLIKSNFKEKILETYRVVREVSWDIPVIGNIGITSLWDIDIDKIKIAMDAIDVDALAVHLNPAQEVIQPEGDTRFGKDLLQRFQVLVKEIRMPIIIKEVGHGLSMETVKLFYEIGVKMFDTAGACGTNWALVEAYRNPPDSVKHIIGAKLSSWGIPTPLSVIEARVAGPGSVIIASGGIWDGIKAVKSLALGSNLVGIARPVLKHLLEGGLENAKKYISLFIEEMRISMFLVGATTLSELLEKPLVLGERIINYMRMRNIDPVLYVKSIRKR
ncbi:MAG: type 2 isopentenyl-diphosphate Delta-isomerase [Desulfurococcaceae archaeon]